MSVSDQDRETIAARMFDQHCTEKGYTVAYRAPFRRWWVAAFRAGWDVAAALQQPKRRRAPIEDHDQ